MLPKPLFGFGDAPLATAAGPFDPTWDSIRAHYRYPQWFSDARFGIFLHWGLYSVPAHGSEWYLTHMYSDQATIDWHTRHYGPPDKFGYKDFIPMQEIEGKVTNVELLGHGGRLKFTRMLRGFQSRCQPSRLVRMHSH